MKKVITLIGIMLILTSWSSAQNGLNFDGSNDIVQTNYAGVLGSANRTFEAWVFVSANAPASNLAIFDYGLNAVGSRNTFSVSASRGLSFLSGGTNANIGTPANTVPVNQWVHVAFVLDNAIGYLYLNGTQVGTGSLSTVNTPSGSGNVRIGERVNGGSIPFHGSIDEVRIWDVAKTVTEIQASMNTEFCGQQPNLQLYLKLNEGIAGGMNTAITTTIDDSGNGYTGTLSNFGLTGNSSNWITGAPITTASGNNTFLTISASNCISYTLPSGNTVTTSGIYMDTIPNTQCGDSILTVNVTINNNTSSSPSLTVCNSYTSPNGDTYTTSQTVNYTLPNAAGCDSLVSLNLTVSNPSSSITETSCGEYISPSGMVMTTSQIFTDIIPSAAGCDSLITIDLTVIEIDDSVTVDYSLRPYKVVSEETDSNATFRWFECDSNGDLTLLFGETNREFAPGFFIGFVAVEITSNGCIDTSACVEFIDVSTQNQYLQSIVSVFPNPTTDNITIDLGETYQDIQIAVYSIDGKMVGNEIFNNQQQINAKIEGTAGLYQVKIITEKGVANKTILKE